MPDFFHKAFSLLSRKEKWLLFCNLIIMIFVAVIDMVGVASILPFMAVVSKPEIVQSNRWLKLAYSHLQFSDVQSFLFFLGMLVLGLLVLSNLIKVVYTYSTLRYDNLLNYTLASRLLASYLARPYEFFLSRNTAEMGKNVLAETRNVIAGVLSPTMQILANSLTCLAILALLTAVDPGVAVAIALILGGAYGAVYLVVRRKLAGVGREQLEASSRKFKAANEALSGIKDLKILGREKVFLDRFAEQAYRHARGNATAGVISQLPRYALETIAFGGILLIVLYSLKSDQEISRIIPILSIYAFAGYRLLPALQQIFAGISLMRVNLPALDLLHQDMSWQGAADPPGVLPEGAQAEALPFDRELRLKGVSFSYSGAKAPALKGIDLALKSKSSIGLVGSTGSGKTTLVDVILGLLSPDSGEITADEVPIRGENVVRWRRNIGYVPQAIYLCDDTLTNNIAFGVPGAEIDMEAVRRASRIANLHDFVTRELPHGYDTVIGERGVRLSGGQRQRIGIARALYRDPAVLIMDEATSALDGITEEAVMEALSSLAGKKTVIMIAHRLTTVKDCDVIYLMEQGVVVDQGTYSELLHSSAWFKAAARVGAESN